MTRVEPPVCLRQSLLYVLVVAMRVATVLAFYLLSYGDLGMEVK